MKKTLELNPKNDWGYYRDYARLLSQEELNDFIPEISASIVQYFDYVENNVHFTAYTSNVESVIELIEILIPYLPSGEREYFIEESKKMMQTAENLRSKKTY